MDEDIITYFFRLLTPEHSDHLFSQLSNLGAPPLERLSRCGISVRRPAEGETIAEAGKCSSSLFWLRDTKRTVDVQEEAADTTFIVIRGRVAVRGSYSAIIPAPESRPAVEAAFPLMIGNGLQRITGFIDKHTTKRHEQMVLPSFAPRSGFYSETQLLPGHMFDIAEFHGRGRGPQAADVSAGPCWILRVDADNEPGVAWLRVARTLFQNQAEQDEKILG